MTRKPPRPLSRAVAALVALAPLVACSGAAVVDALTPHSGYTVERDLAYGDDPRQRLDLYRPAAAASEAPLVVFFYGGNWQSGAKELYRFVGQAFASRGYLTAIPDYRLYPQVRFPEFVADGAAAVAWLSAHEGPRRVLLVGHSAGAYIAAMLALNQRWLGPAGRDCRPIAAMAGLAGPYDFLPLRDPTLIEVFGPRPAGPDTQPVAYVREHAPPMLLATGTADRTVRPANSSTLARRLDEVGAHAELIEYPGVGHVAIVAALAAPLRFLAPVLADVDRFFDSVGCANAGAAQAARTNGTGR